MICHGMHGHFHKQCSSILSQLLYILHALLQGNCIQVIFKGGFTDGRSAKMMETRHGLESKPVPTVH